MAVEEVYDTGEHETVYNLRVADFHTYFVGSESWGFSVWAHNADCAISYEGGQYVLRDKNGKVVATNASQERVVKAAEAKGLSIAKSNNGKPLLAEIEAGTPGELSIVGAKPRLADRLLKKQYENPGDHDPASPNFSKSKSVLPDDHVDLFKQAFVATDGPSGSLWTIQRDSSGASIAAHRFQGQNDAYHWNVATNSTLLNGTPRPIPMSDLPPSLRRMLNG